MYTTRPLRLAWIAALLAILGGCAPQAQESAAPAASAPAPEPPKADAAEARREPAQDQLAELATEAERPTTPDPEAAAPVSEPEFQPPYPERDDYFKRPEIAKVARTDSAARDSAVELKGFVDVEGLKALVTIDGLLTTVAQGEQHSGIEIIEVAPPKVIFQRGRVRWTEALFQQQVQ
ncbi:MAG: hypothetical protein K1X74_17095 [Pirellulales bacterium]|nr:hypothetical protein [Pirellulales bacterium]